MNLELRNSIYLDHNATTPIDPEVRAVIEACQAAVLGNPSSLHAAGQRARAVVEKARAQVACLLGAQPEEIVFTSGGTEADNLAILGAVAATAGPRRHVLTTAIEHQAVLNPCRHLERSGYRVTRWPVGSAGVLKPGRPDALLPADAVLVSVMLANNDLGTIQPVAEVAALTKPRGVLLHTDAVQAVGKLPVDVNALGVDLLSCSAHKLHGPKGVGALYVRRGTPLAPLCFGGNQERGLRPGTENVAAITGFGQACELAGQRLESDRARVAQLRDLLEESLLARVRGAVVHGRGASRIATTTNIGFEGVDGEALALNLDLLGVAVSTGSACTAADREPSHVLLALGCSAESARSAVRFSLGRLTTPEEVAQAVTAVERAVASLRKGPHAVG